MMKICRCCGSSDLVEHRARRQDHICRPCRNAELRKYSSGVPYERKIQKHGGVGTSEYKIWSGIKERCFIQTTDSYPSYGGRGITMCENWRKSFPSFLKDMGPRPSPAHSIDRINNDGNYEPGNCRWATAKEQVANRRPPEQWSNPRPNPVVINIGDRFGRLEVVADLGCPVKAHMYLCRCDCGKSKEVMRGSLVRGHTRSCGCLKQEWLNGPRGLRPGSRRYIQAHRAQVESAEPIPMPEIEKEGE